DDAQFAGLRLEDAPERGVVEAVARAVVGEPAPGQPDRAARAARDPDVARRVLGDADGRALQLPRAQQAPLAAPFDHAETSASGDPDQPVRRPMESADGFDLFGGLPAACELDARQVAG